MNSVCIDDFEGIGGRSSRPLDSVLRRVSRSADRVVGATDRPSDAVQAPSHASENRSVSMEALRSLRGGDSPSKNGNSVLDSRQINDGARDILVSVFGDDPHAAKRLARFAGCTPRHAKAALSGETGLGLAAFMNLARQIPALKGYVCRLLGMDGALDPEMEHELQRLQENLNRILAERRAAG